MSTRYISATDLKNNTSEILNSVYYEKSEAVIERHGKIVAVISPPKIGKKTEKDYKAIADKYFGIMPDFPDVTKYRVNTKRKIAL